MTVAHPPTVPEPVRAKLRGAKRVSLRAAEPHFPSGREKEFSVQVDRSQKQLHRFFQELLRRSEH